MEAVAAATLRRFELSAEESACFLRIVAESTTVTSHYALYRWLQGEVQQFLPHQILVCAWGDFMRWRLTFDVTSGLPGVRTELLTRCPIDSVVRKAHARWLDAGRAPVLLQTHEVHEPHACCCPLHMALHGMRSLVVHGIADQRSGQESLYLALSSGPLAPVRKRFGAVADALVSQIESAFRRVAAFPVAAIPAPAGAACRVLDLSEREREILESVCAGKTNDDIALALAISPFTVKNHVQRIFRKIGVTNRTQAAARYHEALRGVPA